ncbi:hypothetical protein [Anaplasma phagocytophilum]|uniref:Uncharacterized protein n=2 Tax=Anaplasma phagocytophilum TaxID=948 RepID=A0A0F3Q0S2_ANAPH|nr:hypothetical protein [Anaplasma phagocytophilum]EOA62260.1 hypothetical protein CRT38_03302 [Anaplasma phagocytophilum str. CRT38]KDB57275.1 hypothetical protein P030_04835 [Anaplasma phagocytophilum str. CRT35]KJV85857.1 hypothetical protein APHCRT_0890 [Anaplasma phagocytophilum str. CRT53-1]
MVSAMHGRCIVSNYGSGYQLVCDRLVPELQSGRCSYFSFLKSLLSVLEHAVESTERAQSIVGQIGRVGCGIDAQRLATAQVRLSRVFEAVVAVIQNAAASEDKEEISRNFLKQTCNELIRECFDALYHISNSRRHSRRRLSIFAEHYTDAFSSVSNAILVVVDAITLMRRAHTYVTTGNTVENSAIIDARRRIARCMNAACYAVHAVPSSTIGSFVEALGGGCSAPEIREMTCYLLQEAALLSSLVLNQEEMADRGDTASSHHSPSQYALDLLSRLLTRLIHRLEPSCPNTRFFSEVFHAAMERTSMEYRDMEGTLPSDDAVIHQRNLSSMLLEAVAMTHMVNASCAARAQKEKGHCARSILETSEKVQKAFSTIRESERLCVDQYFYGYILGLPIGDANVCSRIRGLVDDAQLLLESIDVNSLPNPALHGELLNRTRKILLDSGALCISLQCGADPEYRPPHQAVMQQRNLSSMLLEAVSAMYTVQTSFNAISPIAGDIENCKSTVLGIGEKLQEALSVLRGRSLTDVPSLGNVNVLSHITGLVADAQLLLESIDVRLLPNPMLHGELLNRTREILIDAGSLCIRLQCAGNPEYRPPQESDFDPGVGGEGNPSTYLAALSTLMSAFSLHSRRQ